MPQTDEFELPETNAASPKDGVINVTLKDSNATGTLQFGGSG